MDGLLSNLLFTLFFLKNVNYKKVYSSYFLCLAC